ncbi:hypothetical protein ABBQ38_005249 [Trebouxia sp. C0009 RCD-2024]
MQRLRLSLLSQLAKQAHFVPAVSPLPGICQLAAPTLCAVTAVLPPTSSEARPVTNFISLRSFAAEPCRIEDPQSAAEALFKASDERAPSLYQPATFPFFARAYYVGNSINLSQLTKRAHKLGYHTYVGKGMVLICAAANTKGKLAEDGTVTGLPLETYVAAYKYGSVVIFNGREREKEVLKLCQEFCTEPTKQNYTEEFPIIIQPDISAPNNLTPERIILRQLEFSNIRTLSHVLGQSVALDRYAEVAERMLSNFMHMNSTMKRRGDFKDVKKSKLLSLVAENNMILTDIIAKLGLQERFDIAWKSNQHNEVYEHLREELEIEERFSIVQTKLELVQDNLKYFLEIMQNNKSVLLEWLIIALISAEIALGVFEITTRV